MFRTIAVGALGALCLAGLALAGVPVTQQTAAPPASPAMAEYNDGWVDVIPVTMMNSGLDSPRGRDGRSLDVFDSTMLLDDYEGSLPAWISADLLAGDFWHLDDTLALGGTGLAWWCGDPRLATSTTGGGYNNHWLQYLLSDTMDLSAATAPVLNFKARWRLEAPGGEPAGYDMWDAWNVWGSTNGGATWTVLTPTSPAYTGNSSYAFGEEWGMGTGIPGYGGMVSPDGYVPVSFSLASLVGSSNALVRWAFCSDPGYCTLEDSTLYGLIIDSIRVTDGALTILSNDGTLDDFVTEVGPTADDVWFYDTATAHSQTHCWSTQMPVYNATRGLYSYPITLPTGYNRLSMRFWVWCDLPDSDGDNNNSLEDYFQVMVSNNDGVTWQQVVYDYGYNNNEPAPGGNSLTGWVYRTQALTSGGTLQPFISLSPWAGQTVRLAFRITTDNNDDGGVGTGLHVDDVEVVATRAFNNDLASRDIVVPFPTTVGLARSWQYTIYNAGLDNQGTVIRSQYWIFRPNGTQQTTASVNLLNTTLASEEDTFVTATWTPDAAGSYLLRARSNLLGDQDRTNDTTWSPTNVPLNSDSNLAVTVRPAGVYELGYHLRQMQNAFLNPRYIRYTPAADGVPSGTANAFDVTQIKIMWQYDPDLADTGATAWIEFWEDGVNPNLPGALINRIEVDIDTSETIGAAGRIHWWTLSLAGIPGMQNRSGNFWVSITPKDSIGGGMVPLILGKSVSPAAYDGHHYVVRLDTAGMPLNPSPGRYLVQTTIVPTAYGAPDPVTNLTAYRDGLTNNVILNWSAPANAFGYKVYRLTTPTQNPQDGTLLTPLPIAATTYTDVGIIPTATRYFYAVIATN